MVGCQHFMKAFIEIRDFSFSFFMLFQTVVKQVLTNGDKIFPVCDTRVKVFCLFSGATRYVPSSSANSSRSYKLLLYKTRWFLLVAGCQAFCLSRTGSLVHILCIGFCYLKGIEKDVAAWGEKALRTKRKYVCFSDSFLFKAGERSIQPYLSSQVWIQCLSS